MEKRVQRIILLVGLALLIAAPAFGRERAAGYCNQGGHVVVTQGLNSDTEVQQSFPSCTVTVYLNGTTTLASIYADNSGTVKGNPFTSDANGYWFFYADNGRYDVHFSNSDIASPYTQGDYLLCDPLDTNGTFTCTGNSAPACTTTIQGSLSITPQTCAGEKTLQGIVGNPSDANFTVTPAADQKSWNIYSGQLWDSFNGDDAATELALGFNAFGALNQLRFSNGFTSSVSVDNQDDTAVSALTDKRGGLEAYLSYTGGTSAYGWGVRGECLMSGGTFADSCDGVAAQGVQTGGTVPEVDDIVAQQVQALSSTSYGVGITITSQLGCGAQNCYAWYYPDHGSKLASTFLNDAQDMVVHGTLGTQTLSAATSNTLCYSSDTVSGATVDDLATCSSLRRFKKDIRSLQPKSSLREVMKLRPVSYTSKTDGRREIHFIAEEVEKVDPRLSTYKPDGSLIGVSDGGMVSLLMSAVQKQQKEIEELKQDVRELRKAK